ncbi:MAG: hypothetical protein RMA76_38495 [Deltaproteobacteria bacterium]|jgi:hypothetical protein
MRLLLLALLLLTACGDDTREPGDPVTTRDAGAVATDGGNAEDAGPPRDAGPRDAGPRDAGAATGPTVVRTLPPAGSTLDVGDVTIVFTFSTAMNPAQNILTLRQSSPGMMGNGQLSTMTFDDPPSSGSVAVRTTPGAELTVVLQAFQAADGTPLAPPTSFDFTVSNN